MAYIAGDREGKLSHFTLHQSALPLGMILRALRNPYIIPHSRKRQPARARSFSHLPASQCEGAELRKGLSLVACTALGIFPNLISKQLWEEDRTGIMFSCD